MSAPAGEEATMTATETTSLRDRSALRGAVEEFLIDEAALLDEWRLEEWLDLFTLDCTYEIPATDRPAADPGLTWSLMHDHRTMLEQRVIRLKRPEAHAEFPHSRTVHLLGNIRLLDDGRPDGAVHAGANFIVNRCTSRRFDTYTGSYRYELVPHGVSFLIRSKRAILAHAALVPQGKISFIL